MDHMHHSIVLVYIANAISVMLFPACPQFKIWHSDIFTGLSGVYNAWGGGGGGELIDL